jgi:hypothetical protein
MRPLDRVRRGQVRDVVIFEAWLGGESSRELAARFRLATTGVHDAIAREVAQQHLEVEGRLTRRRVREALGMTPTPRGVRSITPLVPRSGTVVPARGRAAA